MALFPSTGSFICLRFKRRIITGSHSNCQIAIGEPQVFFKILLLFDRGTLYEGTVNYNIEAIKST